MKTLQPSSRISLSGTKSAGKSMTKSLKDGRYSVDLDHGSEILNNSEIWGCWHYAFPTAILPSDDHKIQSSFCGQIRGIHSGTDLLFWMYMYQDLPFTYCIALNYENIQSISDKEVEKVLCKFSISITKYWF